MSEEFVLPKLTDLDYELLSGNWDGPPGAAFNAISEDMLSLGYMDIFGFVTDRGKEALKEYENRKEKT